VALNGTITFNTSGSVSSGWAIQVTNANDTAYTGPEITGQLTYHPTFVIHLATGGSVYKIDPTEFTAGEPLIVSSGATTSSTSPIALDLQTGATNVLPNRLALNLPVLTATSLGLASVSLDTLSGAQDAQSVLSTALTTLTTAQAHIGAQLDQLQTGATNLSTESVNTQASHATIGSASLSQIMQQVTQGQVLEQNSLQMLADSNHLAQSVLTLLHA
jgi:flagellin-like hook-associated protein FlgL